MKKNKPNWFFRLLVLSFFIFCALYIADVTGYYEKSVRKQAVMTEEARAQFEKDLSENKAVDINDYLPKEVDYSNVFTKSANKLESSLNTFFEDDMASVWEFLKTLFIG